MNEPWLDEPTVARTSAVKTPLLPAMNALGSPAGAPFHPPTLKVDVRSEARLILKTFQEPLIEFAPPLPISAHIVELLGDKAPAEVSAEMLMALPQAEVPLHAAGKSGLSMVFELMCSDPATLFWSPPMYWIAFAPTRWMLLLLIVAVHVFGPLPLPFISMVMPLQFPLHPEVAVPAAPIVLPVMVPFSVAPLLSVPVERIMAVPLAGVPNAEP